LRNTDRRERRGRATTNKKPCQAEEWGESSLSREGTVLKLEL